MRLAARSTAAVFGLVFLLCGPAFAQSSPTLARIAAAKTIRIAYRTDAPPFSISNSLGEPAGFIVDLCKAVADQIRQQLNLPTLPIAFVQVSAADSLGSVKDGRADLMCGPVTATLSRSKDVDFSISTFVSGASLLTHGAAGPKDLRGLAGQQVGVLSGTTTEQELRNTLAQGQIAATIVPLKSYPEGLAMLDQNKISALFGDRTILMFEAAQAKNPNGYSLADPLTVEPYALVLPRGDDDFRLAVNTALSHIYRSPALGQILGNTFGQQTKFPDILKALYLLSAYPE